MCGVMKTRFSSRTVVLALLSAATLECLLSLPSSCGLQLDGSSPCVHTFAHLRCLATEDGQCFSVFGFCHQVATQRCLPPSLSPLAGRLGLVETSALSSVCDRQITLHILLPVHSERSAPSSRKKLCPLHFECRCPANPKLPMPRRVCRWLSQRNPFFFA